MSEHKGKKVAKEIVKSHGIWPAPSSDALQSHGGITKTALLNLLEDLHDAKTNLQSAKEYLENIVKSMIDTLVIISPEGNIQMVNYATLDLLGYNEEELIGKPVATLFAEEEEEEEEEEFLFKGTKLERLMEEGSIHDYDMTYRTKTGEEIPVSFSGSVMREPSASEASDDSRKIIGIVGIAHDMREIKRLMQKEKELAAAAAAAADADRKAKVELEKAYEEIDKEREEIASSYAELQESKDELVRSEKLAFTGRVAVSIAHEIRNPLTSVVMSVEQLKKAIKPEKPMSEKMDILKRNTERINYLITELLNSARPPKLKIQPCNINKVLEDILELNKTTISSKKIKVVKRFTSKQSKISVDKEQVGRAFSNIIINGIESMRRGGTLTIVTEPDEKIFIVKLQDTGKGIPEEDITRIFDPFFSSKSGGVGLGLTICYGIIVSHGGTIEVESEPKKGSTFKLSLPMA